ncbi:hypothetical protein SAMN05421676_11218 [Salinibacillus kushneri]|uniref:Uncharacterized protein n=1 Tax=Salinibacillus kushneri TaxID=237682 RepID=A0A1I0IDP9_9BACI|nr:hypothetical protein SAMN05421676_11218 [Salinibacillus kushneri]
MSEFPFFVPKNYKKGYMKHVMYSVTVEINRHIGIVKRAKKKPSKILLGSICSVKFCHEKTGFVDMRRAPKTYAGLPIVYHVQTLVGVAVVPVEHDELTHNDS